MSDSDDLLTAARRQLELQIMSMRGSGLLGGGASADDFHLEPEAVTWFGRRGKVRITPLENPADSFAYLFTKRAGVWGLDGVETGRSPI